MSAYRCLACGDRTLVLSAEIESTLSGTDLHWVVRCANGHGVAPTLDTVVELHHCHLHRSDEETIADIARRTFPFAPTTPDPELHSWWVGDYDDEDQEDR